MENSICFFSSFFSSGHIPYYVKYYVEELQRHFTKVVFLTNEKEMSAESTMYFQEKNIELFLVKNEGFDFGMWYKAFQKYPTEKYTRVGLINDSCILFRTIDDVFEAIERSPSKYIGMVKSDRYHSHIQSFFVVIKDEAIQKANDYFEQNGLVSDYRQVIQKYEIGLSAFMIENGISIEGLYNKGHEGFEKNPSFARVKELIEEGMPLIKKKIVFRNYRGLEFYWIIRMNFDADYRKYIALIRKKYPAPLLIDFNEVMKDGPIQHHRDIFWFAIGRNVANFIRKIPFARTAFHACISLIKKWRK